MLEYALRLETRHIHEPNPNRMVMNEFNLLNELDRVNDEHLQSHPHIHWTESLLGSGRSTSSLTKYETTFLHLATRAGLVLYLRHKMAINPKQIRKARGRPYLYYALQPIMAESTAIVNHDINPGVEVLRFLLEEQHQDPNEKVGRLTVWSHFVSGVYMRRGQYSTSVLEYMCDVIRLLLRHGADPSTLCPVDSSEVPVIDALKKAFPNDARRFEEIVNSKRLLVVNNPSLRERSPIRSLLRKILSKD